MFISKSNEIKIEDESRCFVIAEVGINHNGSLKEALKYLDLVKRSGADAIKFQLFKAESLLKKGTPTAKYQKDLTNSDDQFSLLKSLELNFEEIKSLFLKSKEINLNFVCTPFDLESLDFLMALEIPFLKLSSGDFDNIFLHKRIIEKKYPVILSTGMANESEIKKITKEYLEGGHNNFAILHCTSLYPAPVEEVNLAYIKKLKIISRAGTVGYSDHTTNKITGALAYLQGSQIIEKHITFSNDLVGPDHKASLNPDDFKDFVLNIRYAQKAKGEEKKTLTKEEKAVKKVARKSLVYSQNLEKGTRIELKHLGALRPSSGIQITEFNTVLNKSLKRRGKKNEVINVSDFKN